MNLQRFHDTWLRWHGFRKAGGLFLGLRINYPISIHDGPQKGEVTTNTTFTSMTIHIGILVVTLSFTLNWNVKPIVTHNK